MDYSQYFSAISGFFWENLFFSGFFILIFPIHSVYQLYKEYQKNKSKSVIWIAVAVFVFLVLMSIPTINEVKDIQNVLNQNYMIATGTAVGWNTTTDESEPRSFSFLTDDGKTVDLRVLPCPPVHKGDRFEIIYLPNSGIGAIVQKLENGA